MLREAHDDEVPRMREWRNQPANREVSIQQHEISPEEHAAWWERVCEDPARRVLVFESGGRGLGVVSFFDLEPAEAPREGAWGFYLDHDTVEREGLAMTAWMQVMREAVDHAFDELGLEVLTGEVLAHNEAVRSMNRRFRFTEGEPEEREVDGRTITVLPLALHRDQRRRRKDSR